MFVGIVGNLLLNKERLHCLIMDYIFNRMIIIEIISWGYALWKIRIVEEYYFQQLPVLKNKSFFCIILQPFCMGQTKALSEAYKHHSLKEHLDKEQFIDLLLTSHHS